MPDLEHAVASFPIVSWLSGHVKVRDTGGKNVYADCPVCLGKHKLLVKRFNGFWKCFKCVTTQDKWRGIGGLPSLVSHLENISWRQALKFIANKAGLPDILFERRERPLDLLPAEAIELSEARPDHPSRLNLERRGMAHLLPRVYVCVSGKYQGRWILPANYRKEVQGFEAKAFLPGVSPKSLFPTWFQSEQETIYTTYEWDDSCDAAIVTESIFDAETFGQNAIGLYGSQLLPGQLDCLLQLRATGTRRLYWALDPDAYLRQASAILRQTSVFFENYIVPLPALTTSGEKGDPNAHGRDACLDYLGKAIQINSELDVVEIALAEMTE